MTTTVTATTIDTASALAIANGFELFLTLTLVALLISKELVVGAAGPSFPRWNDSLRVGVVPLTITFAFIVTINFARFMT